VQDLIKNLSGVPGNQLLTAAVVLLGFYILARITRRFMRRQLARREVRADMALLVERVTYAGLVGIGIFVALATALGSSTAGLTGVIVAAFITSLGLQDLFKSYVAGFYILLERTVTPGRLIETTGYRGVVTDVRMRTTYLTAEDGGQIVVPNIELFSKALVASDPPEGWGKKAELAKPAAASGESV
jgi:small-conductance mechanosensitive channel